MYFINSLYYKYTLLRATRLVIDSYSIVVRCVRKLLPIEIFRNMLRNSAGHKIPAGKTLLPHNSSEDYSPGCSIKLFFITFKA